MRTNAPDSWSTHTQETPSGLKAKHGRIWAGRAAGVPEGVPMWHPCATTCHPSRHQTPPRPLPLRLCHRSAGCGSQELCIYVARTVCAVSAPDHLLKELLQVVPVKGFPASYALSISDKQGCDCYSVGAVARDLEALAGADELGRVELAGDERAWRESLAQRHDHVHALAHVAHRLQLLLGSTISLPVGGVVLWLLPVKRQLVVLCGG